MQGSTNRKLYYGWVVVWVVFAALLVSAGVRAAPTVLINPLESEFGWGRAAISAAVSIGLLLYGLSGPAAGWLMDRFGPKPLTLFGLGLIGLSTLMGAAMTELWQLNGFPTNVLASSRVSATPMSTPAGKRNILGDRMNGSSETCSGIFQLFLIRSGAASWPTSPTSTAGSSLRSPRAGPGPPEMDGEAEG